MRYVNLLAEPASAGDFADVIVPAWGWPMLIGVITLALLIDLFVFHRQAHVIEIREAAIESAGWVGLGLAFSGVIWWMFADQGKGTAAALEYLSAYLIEKSLSVDNVFVWAVIFAHFGVPIEYQHRTLFWGIFGALVLRFVFIVAGVAVIERFEGLLLVFGVFLVYTGIKLLRADDKPIDPSQMAALRLFRRLVPSTTEFDGQKMFTRRSGKLLATPLLAVLVVVEATDVIFAVDSVPAVLAISRARFIVFASNAFAILGLRALYFLLADMQTRFYYLKHSISAILVFVGVKMTLSLWLHVPTAVALGFIALVLVLGVVASLRRTAVDGAADGAP
ncbi:MAG: TerC family protein [Chloroflexi bacterium]|nr:TerC family protein [Chloroflexota bacterium]